MPQTVITNTVLLDLETLKANKTKLSPQEYQAALKQLRFYLRELVLKPAISAAQQQAYKELISSINAKYAV